MAVPPDSPEAIRLNRYLASCGLGSRRSCEQLVRQGRVEVNGSCCTSLAIRINPATDRVVVDGEEVRSTPDLTLIVNKPRGYLCTRSDPQHRQVVYDLLPPHLRHLHHVGRLDFHSQGLLILTNSGVLTTTLTHPRHEIEKEYFVTLNQAIEPGLKQAFSKGVRIPGGIARAKSVHIIGPRRCRIILKQGLKRQIREMFAVRGYTVVRLERIRIGQFTAPTLALGKWRVLGPAECALLTAC